MINKVIYHGGRQVLALVVGYYHYQHIIVDNSLFNNHVIVCMCTVVSLP